MLFAGRYSDWMSRYSHAQAISYLEAKIGRALTDFEHWSISTVIFGKYSSGEPASPLESSAWSTRYVYFDPKFYVSALLICAPILIFTLAIWRWLAKGEKGFWRRSPYYLFMLAPLVIVPEFLFFADIDRLVWAALLTQVLLAAFVYMADGQNGAFTRLKECSLGKNRWNVYLALLLGIVIPLLLFSVPAWLNPGAFMQGKMF